MKFNFFKEEFFEKYKDCEEMEKKPNRPYACTTLVNCMGVTFAVPLRSHIRHEYAVFTDKEKTKGLDLTKAVVVNDVAKYIDTETKVYIKNDFIYLCLAILTTVILATIIHPMINFIDKKIKKLLNTYF